MAALASVLDLVTMSAISVMSANAFSKVDLTSADCLVEASCGDSEWLRSSAADAEFEAGVRMMSQGREL